MAKGNKTSYAPNGKVFVILILGLGFCLINPLGVIKQFDF